MAIRFYVVPKIGDGLTISTAFRPKYFGTGETFAATLTHALDYGREAVFLVRADVTNAQNTNITANADDVGSPTNIDNAVGANLTTLQNRFEAAGIPAGWVTSGMTYRTVLRWTARLFLIAQRLHGMVDGRMVPPGITLNSTIGDLTVAQRDALQEAALRLGVTDFSGVTLATTIRDALKALADQITIAIRIDEQEL
jgi:hypothetical protein